MTLLGGMLMLFAGPATAVFGIHPGTLVLVGVYAYGLRLVTETGERPMWEAVETDETRTDVPDEPRREHGAPSAMWARFMARLALLAGGGTTLAIAGESRRERRGLGNIGLESVVVLVVYLLMAVVVV